MHFVHFALEVIVLQFARKRAGNLVRCFTSTLRIRYHLDGESSDVVLETAQPIRGDFTAVLSECHRIIRLDRSFL